MINKNNRNIFFLILILVFFIVSSAALYSYNVEIALNATVKTNFIGIPKGMDDEGLDAYIDLSENNVVYQEFGSAPPAEWDLKFTYEVREVSMGPMGKNPVPYFKIQSNEQAGVVFYPIAAEYDSLTEIDVFDVPALTDYVFPGGKRFEYQTPEETFVFRLETGETVKLKFNEIIGIDENEFLFSASFKHEMIQ